MYCRNCGNELLKTDKFCEKCGKAMVDGFVFGDGTAYYCSEECLHQDYTDEEDQKMYEEDEAFYTEWYDL